MDDLPAIEAMHQAIEDLPLDPEYAERIIGRLRAEG